MYIYRLCLHVVLVSLLKRELEEFTDYWNSHAIRANRTAECPSGIPDDLYQMPQEFGLSLLYQSYISVLLDSPVFITIPCG